METHYSLDGLSICTHGLKIKPSSLSFTMKSATIGSNSGKVFITYSNLNIAFAIGSLFGYPFYQVKNMLEQWPKERGGHCTWEGSYWNAVKWLRINYENYNTNMYTGYWHWFRTKGIIFYLVIVFLRIGNVVC